MNFEDVNGNLLYGPVGDAQSCESAPLLYSALPPVPTGCTSPRTALTAICTTPRLGGAGGDGDGGWFPEPQHATTVQLYRAR